MFISPYINVIGFSWIWPPTIIKILYLLNNIPFIKLRQYFNIAHVFAFGSIRIMIFKCWFYFSTNIFVSPSIDISRFSRIWSPCKIKLSFINGLYFFPSIKLRQYFNFTYILSLSSTFNVIF